MNVQFDWLAGDEQDGWETIARAERSPVFRVSRRVWRMLLLALVVVAVGGTLGVRYRYQVALRRLTSDIQAAIDLEAWALEQRDHDLFMAMQDVALPEWRWHQAVRFLAYCDPWEASPWAVPGKRRKDCVSGPQPEIQKVQLHGDVAWVEVVEGHPPMRYRRFYRQTDYGWKHTAPRPEFWKTPLERRYGSVTVRAQLYDLAHVEPLVEHLARVVDEVNAGLDYRGNQRLEVDFVLQDSFSRVPGLKDGELILASPWLVGIPAEAAWAPEYLDTLDYWAAYWAVGQYVQPVAGTSNNSAGSLNAGSLNAGSLNPVQRALVDEYALLYSRGDLAETPILNLIIERHGIDVLPEMLASLREPQDASTFLTRWLLVSPANDEVYYDTLAGIMWRAMVDGRGDSCALLHQVLAREDANWMDRVEYELTFRE